MYKRECKVERRSAGEGITRESLLQGIRAPMVLENLDCSGTEMKLVDCPGAMDDVETVYTDYGVSAIRYSFVYYGEFHTYCDPARGTYAFVACGQATESGASSPESGIYIVAVRMCLQPS